MAQAITQTSRAGLPSEAEASNPRPAFPPRTDIVETSDNIMLVADLPGVSPEGVDVTLEGRVLTIRGHVDARERPGYHMTYREYGEGDYQRSFTLTDEIDRDGIEASLVNGALQLTLPKAQPAKARKIPLTPHA